MDQDSPRTPDGDDVVVLPPVPLDPVFAEAVEDALAGEQVPTSPLDPNRVLGADPHDFAGLYIRHRSSFALHARRFLRDPRDVDEVVQEAFLRLFLALPELGGELQALAYCRRTITNLCIDRYRADMRRPRLIDLESVPSDVLTEDEHEDPVVQAEDAAIVREALALLSPLHREALVKREIEEKPLPVIAAELDIPEESVKHLLHRARRALRRRLAETHLAPGVDLDDVSTLSLLARSAVSGTGRVGVLALLLAGLVAGASSHVPVEAVETLSGLWRTPAAPPAPRAAAVPREPDAVRQPAGALGLERDLPGPLQASPYARPRGGAAAPAAAAVAVPAAAPLVATSTVSTAPSATASPSSPSATPSPTATATATATASATAQPSSLPGLAPLRPRPSESPSPVPTAGPTSSAGSSASAARTGGLRR